jgi:hypothetical protein
MVRYTPAQTEWNAVSSILQQVIVSERVYIAQNITCSLDQIFHCFSTDELFEYRPVQDEFGPLRLSRVIAFTELLSNEIATHPHNKVVYYVGKGSKNLTNAVFLLGAYMILKLNETAESASKRFDWIVDGMLEPYSAASGDDIKERKSISLNDCWIAVEHAKKMGWLRMPNNMAKGTWGMYNPEEYEHYHSPINADMHQIIPDKLVVLTSPVQLLSGDYRDERSGVRRFSPSYFVGIFEELGVSAVVSLGAPAYDPHDLVAAGIAHRTVAAGSLRAAVDQVLAVAEAETGAVAVHAGGGAAGGSLVAAVAALSLIRRCGFAARAAAAWVRICRPGPAAAAAFSDILKQGSFAFEESLASQADIPSAKTPAAGSPRSGSSNPSSPAVARPATAVAAAGRPAPPLRSKAFAASAAVMTRTNAPAPAAAVSSRAFSASAGNFARRASLTQIDAPPPPAAAGIAAVGGGGAAPRVAAVLVGRRKSIAGT